MYVYILFNLLLILANQQKIQPKPIQKNNIIASRTYYNVTLMQF